MSFVSECGELEEEEKKVGFINTLLDLFLLPPLGHNTIHSYNLGRLIFGSESGGWDNWEIKAE